MISYQTSFWNLIIWLAGRLADTGWVVTQAGDFLMEIARQVGFDAKAHLESEGR